MSEMPDQPKQLAFEIDTRTDPSLMTAHAGMPRLIDLMRTIGVTRILDEQVHMKRRRRGLYPSQLVETLVALWVVGRERCQNLGVFCTDTALAVLLGYELPAATTVRDFLEAFHAEAVPLWQAGEKATVPLRRTGRSAGIGWRRTVLRDSSETSTAEIQVKVEVKGQVEAEIRHSLTPGEADVG
ncbi:MAG: hypothetical protein HZB35_05625 [Nitrospirae bacterium]|nr:hypothetical protein [Nitrospirota bacterium]